MTERPMPAAAAVRANEQILGAMLVLHGGAHTIGFVLEWRLFEPSGFSFDDVWPAAGTAPGRVAGVLWMVVAIALVVVGARLANRRDPSVVEVATPLVGSLVLCALSFPAALPGAAISAGVLTAIVAIRLRRRAAERTLDPGAATPGLEGSGT